ncbi:DNA repair protein XRCC3-like [Gigantopelta aegis]|uniref:DNA repair protein XRCC3-like n=1 Tax=Gigantopelta aegis TaxID=1735272 RepID=UPI001B8881CA|nr:DNA repair protein XRCC3-like [Gigantopelta aegis]
MSIEQLDIHPRILKALRKVHLVKFEKILSLSSPDVARSTGLSTGDVQVLQEAVAEAIPKPPVITALSIWNGCSDEFKVRKLSTGCTVFDKHLRGGFISRGITEICGESASGKSRIKVHIGLFTDMGSVTMEAKVFTFFNSGSSGERVRSSVTLSAGEFTLFHRNSGPVNHLEFMKSVTLMPRDASSAGFSSPLRRIGMFSDLLHTRYSPNACYFVSCAVPPGAVYLCTEDVFPNKRLYQLIHHFSNKWASLLQEHGRLGDKIFVEHVADLDGLQFCIHKKFPVLLAKGVVQLIVIDSVAALFRCEFDTGHMIQRAKHLSSFAAQLHRLGYQYNIPIICVNQYGRLVIVMHIPLKSKAYGDELSMEIHLSSFAAQLHRLGYQYNIPIICVNQVSANMSCTSNTGRVSRHIPSLGLTWANQVTSRFMLSRTDQQLTGPNDTESVVRLCEVMFAPNLPRVTFPFVVDQQGVKGVG